jgi:hypothetical protein
VRTTIVPFEPALLPAVVRFAERTWDWGHSADFYRWRFCDAPAETLLMVRGDECLAILGAFRRQYRVGGADATYAETFDWYSLPECRNSGLGVLLLREMMSRPEPMLVVGGSADTMTMLPRMGWRDLPEAGVYVLPLAGSAISDRVQQAWRIPKPVTEAAFDLFARFWFRSRPRHRSSNFLVQPVDTVDDEILSLYRGDTGYGCLPIPDLDRLRWLTSGPRDTSRFVASYFRVGGTLRGWSLAKVYDTADSCEASLVECYAPRPDVETYRWMVSETVGRVEPFQPRKVLARATCPVLQAALRDNRFLSRDAVPVRMWSGGQPLPPAPIHLTYNVGDADMLPYSGTPPSRG